MNTGIIGAGYVGLVTGACLASQGHTVVCTDIDIDKVAALSRGNVTIYEPGLEELVRRGLASGNLRFTSYVPEVVRECRVIFIAVGTPAGEDGTPDTSAVFKVASTIRRHANGPKTVVIKSTAPVGTSQAVRAFITEDTRHKVTVVSNPEFLREGHSVEDFIHPARVVVGADDIADGLTVCDLYRPFVPEERILLTDTRSAEMSKYASNAFLATKVSFINEIAHLCEKLGADVDMVRRVVGLDPRVGPAHLSPGMGYGGSCLPKDVEAVLHMAESCGMSMDLVSAVQRVNQGQVERMVGKVLDYHGGSIDGKRIAVWGLAFKPGTNDVRNAPSLALITRLRRAGAMVAAYDPQAMDAARALANGAIHYPATQYECLEGADALVLVTEWEEFHKPDWARMRKAMRTPVIFDGRNVYDAGEVEAAGFSYFGVGRDKMAATGKGLGRQTPVRRF